MSGICMHYIQGDDEKEYTAAEIATINHRRRLANLALHRLLPFPAHTYLWIPRPEPTLPAPPRNLYKKYAPVPEATDPRWNIWTVDQIISVGTIHSLGLKLDILREVLKNSDAEVGVARWKRSKFQAAALLAGLKERRRMIQPPAGWKEEAPWWEYLPEQQESSKPAPPPSTLNIGKQRKRMTKGQQHQRSLVLYQPNIVRKEKENVSNGIYNLGDNSEMLMVAQMDAARDQRADIIHKSRKAAKEPPRWKRPLNLGGGMRLEAAVPLPDDGGSYSEGVEPSAVPGLQPRAGKHRRNRESNGSTKRSKLDHK